MASQLPQELIDDIVDQVVLTNDDFFLFWDVGRRVCRRWRSQTARTYAKLFLQTPGRCMVHFDLDWHLVVDARRSFAVEMVFDRFDPADSRRCIFKETEQTGPPYPASWQQDYIDVYERSKYSIWRQKLDMYMGVDLPENESGRIDIPPYVLSIYGRPNDTELPGLEIDYEKREISFDWEGMFSKFCYEEAEFDRVLCARAEDLQKWKPQIDEVAGPDAKAKKMMDAIAAFLRNMRAARKDVRRRRIIRHFKVHDESDFEFNSEHESLEREQLKRIEQAQGVGKDEDDDEDEDDEMDDEDDEDEWTDEDGTEDEEDD